MKMYKAIVCLLLIFGPLLYARLDILDTDPTHIKLLSTREMRFCYISFVQVNGKTYLIKQKKLDCLRKIVGVVRDSITAHIAESFNIAHLVDIIPAGKAFPGKPCKEWPATIHSIAPGKMIKEQESPYKKMKIQQKDGGFRLDMLDWMGKHPELIIIIALDVFVCNHDRHRGNLFYNKATNSFCAIDMDSAYKYNLCAIAYKNFVSILNNRKINLDNKEVYTLMQFRKHLQFLIDTHHPQDTLMMYDYFSNKAGFVPGSRLYTDRVAAELMSNRAMIVQSYEDAKRLVIVVDKLIRKHQKSVVRRWSIIH